MQRMKWEISPEITLWDHALYSSQNPKVSMIVV